jgi:uncharacterized protein (TIGR02265 family)
VGVNEALFEGLFCVALDVSGELEAELKRHGYDRRKPKPSYDGAVLLACLTAARKHLHPTKSEDEGLRALGQSFVQGFRKTVLGGVLTAALPFLGPARFLPRLPGRFASLRSDAKVTVEMKGPRAATLSFSDPLPLGSFYAGAIETALGVAKAESPKVVPKVVPGGYLLEASW